MNSSIGLNTPSQQSFGIAIPVKRQYAVAGKKLKGGYSLFSLENKVCLILSGSHKQKAKGLFGRYKKTRSNKDDSAFVNYLENLFYRTSKRHGTLDLTKPKNQDKYFVG